MAHFSVTGDAAAPAVNERSVLLQSSSSSENERGEQQQEEQRHRNPSSLLQKIARARKQINVPSAIGGFAIGVKFGFVLLLMVFVSMPRENFESLRTNLGEFLPMGLSERFVAPESSYKREHGSVAHLGSAKPLAGGWNPNSKATEKRAVKYPRKDLTPKPTAKKKVEEEEEEEKKKKSSSKSSHKEDEEKKSSSSSSSSKHSKKGGEREYEDGNARARSSGKNEEDESESPRMGRRKEDEERGHGDKNDWYNGAEPIPHLIDHLEAHDLKPSDKDLRILTIANAAYWPLAEIMLDSAKRHAPEIANRLTFILSDEKSVKRCKDRVTKSCQHTCFFDHEMEDMLGKYTKDEGSYKSAYDSNFGVKLRQLWTWRKVKAVKTLVDAGYAAMFVDASTVF